MDGRSLGRKAAPRGLVVRALPGGGLDAASSAALNAPSPAPVTFAPALPPPRDMPEPSPSVAAQHAGTFPQRAARVTRPASGGAVCETPRLRLRELTPGDLPFVALMLGDAAVMRYYPKALTMDEAREWLHRQLARYDRDGHGLWLVEDRATGEPRGQVGLAVQRVEDAREPEIGWLVHHPFWRQGLASEAAAAVRDLAFSWGYDHVISLIRPENSPSQGVARRIGMRVDREVIFHGYRHLVFLTRRADAATTAGAR